MRLFNTTGPCNPQSHYMVPAAERLPEAPRLIDQGAYFVVHAPPQTGKTTTLMALAEELTRKGEYAALYVSCEIGRRLGEDLIATQRAILRVIQREAAHSLPPELQPPPWPTLDCRLLLTEGLHAWSRQCPRRLVLVFDEIDALRGHSLLNVLRQLRAYYDTRPELAPWSAILSGIRDVSDYATAKCHDPSWPDAYVPFNINTQSIRLGDFTAAEVSALYAQHTADTGQEFTAEAVARAFDMTQGQPWLVNALAREIIEKMKIPPPEPITAEHVEQAKERLILARATHLDSLVERLTEPRVQDVIEPLMAGTRGGPAAGSLDYIYDLRYVGDLGLIAPGRGVRMANPIYGEVIARVLAEYQIMAFLQRIVTGAGFIDREFEVGRDRIDLLIRWPCSDTSGARQWQREALELKVWRDKKADPRDRGLAQLDEYLDQLGLDHGVLVLFDRRTDALPHAERSTFEQAATPTGRAITILQA